MSQIFATAGSKVYIGGTMAFNGADKSASDFSGETWTQIGGLTNIGSFGDTADLISTNHLSSVRVLKLKGVRNAGSMALVADIDYADAGQLAVIAAEKVRDAYAFKVEFNDAPSGGTPSERYFVALVMSATEQLNEANSMLALNATLEIVSNIVRVAAAEA